MLFNDLGGELSAACDKCLFGSRALSWARCSSGRWTILGLEREFALIERVKDTAGHLVVVPR
jgi:hypothetical protein